MELDRFEEGLSMEALAPSRRVLLRRVWEQIRSDMADAKRVVEYADVSSPDEKLTQIY